MTLKTVGTSDRISLDFYWEGSNIRKENGLNVEAVDLVFKDAQKAISVRLPENFNPVAPARMSFVCREQQKTESEGQVLDSLSVTVEQTHNLTIKARFFEKDSPLSTNSDIALEIPEELEVGQTYNLVVTSENLSLSARLVKEKPENLHSEDATIAEWQGPSENANCEENPTQSKTDSPSCFGITNESPVINFFVERMCCVSPLPPKLEGFTVKEDFISQKLHDEFIAHVQKNCIFSSFSRPGLYDGFNFKNHEKYRIMIKKIAAEIFPKLAKDNIFAQRPTTIGVTLLKYDQRGCIPPHQDNPKQIAGPVVTLSFGSDIVFNLLGAGAVVEDDGTIYRGDVHKFLIKKRSMYCMQGTSQTGFRHGIYSDEITFQSEQVNRGERYALLLTPPGPDHDGVPIFIPSKGDLWVMHT